MNATPSPFTPELYRFLGELSAHNERLWFNANKERYLRDVRDPMSQFIVMIQEPMRKVSKHIRVDPRTVGGSMFRIYRDTRFSKDKTPYKTHAACSFRHSGGDDVHSVGYYMHVGPEENFVGGGVWRPPTATARLIRARIAAYPDPWRRATTSREFRRHIAELGGEQLKRVPREFDPDHPLGDDLRRKDFVASARLTDQQVTGPGFIDEVISIYRAMGPFMAFLAEALGLAW